MAGEQPLTLADMSELGFYELLGCGPGDDKRTISRRFKALAKIYHPDKGGGAEEFKYLRKVYEVLYDDEKRTQYDNEGKGSFTKPFNEQEPQPQERRSSVVVPSPPINEDFLNKLLDTQGSLVHTVGNLPLRDYIKAALERRETNDHYGECKVAQQLGLNLCLVAKTKNLPIYPQPRVLRYAAFMGMQLLELDVPSSHGQQALKYAREHGLERTLLERAFATTKKIRNFRRSLDMDEVLAKTAINMIVGGSGLVNVKTECSLPELHDDLLKLRQELEGMRQHMWDNCPPEWVNELKMEKKST